MGTFIHYFNTYTVYKDDNGVEKLVARNNTPQEYGAYRLRVPLYGQNYLNDNGVFDWRVELVDWLDSNTNGSCFQDEKVIRININVLWELNLNQIKDLLLHEVAHAIVGCHHKHDEVWRQKAIEIGCKGLEFRTFKLIEINDGNAYKIVFPE